MTSHRKNSGQAISLPPASYPAFSPRGGSSVAATIPAGGQDSFSVFADVFDVATTRLHLLSQQRPQPGELVQSFKIEERRLQPSDPSILW